MVVDLLEVSLGLANSFIEILRVNLIAQEVQAILALAHRSIHTDVTQPLIHLIDVLVRFVEELPRQVNAIEMTLLLSLGCNRGHLAIKFFISIQRVVGI